MITLDTVEELVRLRPVAALQGFAYLLHVPREDLRDEEGILPCEDREVVARGIPAVLFIAGQGEDAEELVAEELVYQVRLLVQLEDVLLEAGALGRTLAVSLFECVLQLVVSRRGEEFDIGTSLRGESVARGHLFAGDVEERHLHPHPRHGEEAQEELVGVQPFVVVCLVQLPEEFRGIGIHWNHPTRGGLDGQLAEAGRLRLRDWHPQQCLLHRRLLGKERLREKGE